MEDGPGTSSSTADPATGTKRTEPELAEEEANTASSPDTTLTVNNVWCIKYHYLRVKEGKFTTITEDALKELKAVYANMYLDKSKSYIDFQKDVPFMHFGYHKGIQTLDEIKNCRQKLFKFFNANYIEIEPKQSKKSKGGKRIKSKGKGFKVEEIVDAFLVEKDKVNEKDCEKERYYVVWGEGDYQVNKLRDDNEFEKISKSCKLKVGDKEYVNQFLAKFAEYHAEMGDNIDKSQKYYFVNEEITVSPNTDNEIDGIADDAEEMVSNASAEEKLPKSVVQEVDTINSVVGAPPLSVALTLGDNQVNEEDKMEVDELVHDEQSDPVTDLTIITPLSLVNPPDDEEDEDETKQTIEFDANGEQMLTESEAQVVDQINSVVSTNPSSLSVVIASGDNRVNAEDKMDAEKCSQDEQSILALLGLKGTLNEHTNEDNHQSALSSQGPVNGGTGSHQPPIDEVLNGEDIMDNNSTGSDHADRNQGQISVSLPTMPLLGEETDPVPSELVLSNEVFEQHLESISQNKAVMDMLVKNRLAVTFKAVPISESGEGNNDPIRYRLEVSLNPQEQTLEQHAQLSNSTNQAFQNDKLDTVDPTPGMHKETRSSEDHSNYYKILQNLKPPNSQNDPSGKAISALSVNIQNAFPGAKPNEPLLHHHEDRSNQQFQAAPNHLNRLIEMVNNLSQDNQPIKARSGANPDEQSLDQLAGPSNAQSQTMPREPKPPLKLAMNASQTNQHIHRSVHIPNAKSLDQHAGPSNAQPQATAKQTERVVKTTYPKISFGWLKPHSKAHTRLSAQQHQLDIEGRNERKGNNPSPSPPQVALPNFGAKTPNTASQDISTQKNKVLQVGTDSQIASINVPIPDEEDIYEYDGLDDFDMDFDNTDEDNSYLPNSFSQFL